MPGLDEEMILPDDFEATPSDEAPAVDEAPQEQETFEESTEDTKPVEETNEPVNEPQKIKIKYNSEEKEIPLEEAALLAQKGMNYEKAVERAKQEARDAWVAEQGYEWKGQPIKTEAEYKQAMREQQIEQELISKYQDRDLPPEIIQEMIENRKFREEIKTKEQKQTEDQQKQTQFNEFIEAFPTVKAEEIPQSVWDKVNQGTPLKFAYMEHEFANMQTKMKVYQQNETNAKRAPVGSVTGHGGQEIAPEDDFLKGFNSI